MALTRHSLRRSLVSASGGAVVVASGAAVGMMAADLAHSWSEAETWRLATRVPPDPTGDVAAARPVVVTVVEETHVTPEPVVVRRTVYRTRVVPGSPSTVTVRSRSRTTRTVVSPPRSAPRPASRPASKPATSKTS